MMTADSVLGMLVGSQAGFDMSSISSNISRIKGGIAGNRQDIENDDYVSYGSATLMLPIDEMTQYLSASTILKMHKMFNRMPDNEDFEEVCRDLGITVDFVNKQMPVVEPKYKLLPSDWRSKTKNGGEYSYENVIPKNENEEPETNVLGDLKAERLKPFTKVIIKEKDEWKEELLTRLRKSMSEYFLDGAKGPYFIKNLFGNAKNPYTKTINDHIGNLMNALKDLKDENDVNIELSIKRLEKLSKEKPSFIGFNGRTKQDIVIDYIEECQNYIKFQKLSNYYQAYVDVFSDYYGQLEYLYNEVYQSYVLVLDKLRAVSEISKRNLEDSNQKSDVLEKSFVDFQYISNSITMYLNDANFNIDVKINNLLKTLWENQEKIIGRVFDKGSDKSIDIITVLKKYLNDEYGEDYLGTTLVDALLWTVSLEKSTTHQLSFKEQINIDENSEEFREFIENDIRQKLSNSSSPRIKLVSPVIQDIEQIQHRAIYEELAVPQDPSCNIVANILNDLLDNQKDKLKRIASTNRLTELKFIFGFPVYMYDNISVCENVYETELLDSNSDGARSLHLYSIQDEIDWRKLSNIIPKTTWREGIRTQTNLDRIKNDLLNKKELFDKCKDYGIIEKDSDGNYQLILESSNIRLGNEEVALMRFQKMYHNVKKAQVQLEKAKQNKLEEEKKKLAQEGFKHYTQAYMAGLITNPNGDSEYVAVVLDEQMPLAKLRGAKKQWLDYELQAKFNEVLSDTQRQALITETMSTLDELDDDLFDQRELELRERIVAAKRNIITLAPENSEAMTEFYEGLEHYINTQL